MTKICYNRHTVDTPDCEGCHHIFHVVESAKVAGGKLVPAVVNGPDACALCHEERHAVPDPKCERCAGRIADNIMSAEHHFGEPVRREIAFMKLTNIMLSWKATLAGVLVLIGGSAAGDWFDDENWVYYTIGIPVTQFFIRREIKNAEKRLPRYAPGGQIVFGEGPDDGEEPAGRVE
ncbi:MAG TPA: hypothetical protein VND22_05475 [Actinomycetota bacterium]|nr:hypothetical protein [Actinomycetota bacterium]